MTERPWRPIVTKRAEQDFFEIIAWTTEHFGRSQADIYNNVIRFSVQALEGGPTIHGVKPRDDIRPGLMSLHVAREGRRGRHYLVFRVKSHSERMIEVLRILHDQMDLAHHIPPTE